MPNFVTIKSNKYPKLLKESVKDLPQSLYYKGTYTQEIFENCLAVVGSRHMTAYGRRVCTAIVTQLAYTGITIVSGFMYGIDACAHTAALNAYGKTIAIMPCGIDLVHPSQQKDLYTRILKNGGLILSEYEGTLSPKLWMYVKRNRIVAGLAKAVLVVEAAQNSGSLITANLAIKTQKPVFAIPGPITSETSKGTLELIKSGKAIMTTSADDILEIFGVTNKKDAGNKTKPLIKVKTKNSVKKQILALLSKEDADIDYISEKLNLDFDQLGATLTMLQLSNEVFFEKGKYYVS